MIGAAFTGVSLIAFNSLFFTKVKYSKKSLLNSERKARSRRPETYIEKGRPSD